MQSGAIKLETQIQNTQNASSNPMIKIHIDDHRATDPICYQYVCMHNK